MTTDSAANIAKGVEEFGAYWIKCVLHCLHNSVLEGLRTIENDTAVLAKVRNFVSYIGSSPKQKQKFKFVQL